ncbi:MAG: hypothetical protein VX309_00595, partial [Pseudomonadota bacterium]|nr:hypothetical protein [Pseudomonadota bacterium]
MLFEGIADRDTADIDLPKVCWADCDVTAADAKPLFGKSVLLLRDGQFALDELLSLDPITVFELVNARIDFA